MGTFASKRFRVKDGKNSQRFKDDTGKMLLYWNHALVLHWSPLLQLGSTLIPAWISNHMPSKVWNEITYLFQNWEFHPIRYNGFNYSCRVLLKLIQVSQRDLCGRCPSPVLAPAVCSQVAPTPGVHQGHHLWPHSGQSGAQPGWRTSTWSQETPVWDVDRLIWKHQDISLHIGLNPFDELIFDYW